MSDHEARPANNESPDLHVDDLLTDDEPSKARPRRAFRRWLIVLGVLGTALAVAVGSALVWGVGQLNAVKREPGLLPSDQPSQTTDLDQQPRNLGIHGFDHLIVERKGLAGRGIGAIDAVAIKRGLGDQRHRRLL